ncbi:MAG: hypothetical protein NTU54_04840 [Candidatus Omnitrophica bacterium]|nr:hypothetical protein [Candidatus Omnitrophota bacterium]
MPKRKNRDKATALFLVLAILFVVVALANMILSFMHSQSRFTHHEVSRIQAYYAAQAAMNYALEKLRTGGWKAGENCTEVSPCHAPGDIPLDYNNTFYPPSINYINVTIANQTNSPITGTNQVNITVDYQYSPTL